MLPCALVLEAAPRQRPDADDLLDRAGRYVTRFVEAFSNVVAEEHYVQEVFADLRRPASVTPAMMVAANAGRPTRRELRSEFLLLKVGGPLEWRPYRDVFEVDGQAVGDREARLVELFLESSPDHVEQAARIARESARYNIGLVRRTVNTPVLALLFLQPAIQPRFRFEIERRDRSLAGDPWIVRFEERARPTIVRAIQRDADADLPASGRFWIDDATGRVVKTELRMSAVDLQVDLTTTFRRDERLDVWAPVEMRERYAVPRSHVIGQARYGQFRRFEVSTQALAGAFVP
jgi:hypothetical protein